MKKVQEFLNNISIKNKIMLFGITLIILILFPIMVSVQSNVKQLVQHSAINEAKAHNRILKQLLLEQNYKLKADADYVAYNNSIDGKYYNQETDILLVVNQNGTIVSSKNNPSRISKKLASQNLINIVQESVNNDKIISSIEVISKDDLIQEGKSFYNRVTLEKKATKGSKAGFKEKKYEEDGLINIYVRPIPGTKDAVLAGSIINGNLALVDAVKNNQDGIAVTIFKDDLRISTTVKNNGKRVLGTLLAANVVDKVLIEGKEYVGRALVVGKYYWSHYIPIINYNKEVIGVLFAATSEEEITRIFEKDFGKSFIFSILIILVMSIPLLLIISSTISKRLADNDLSVDIPVDNSKTEMGNLYRSFKKFIDNLKYLISKINESVQEVSANSEEMSAAAEQTAQGAQQTANSIQQLARGSQEQASSVSDSLENINLINKAIQKILDNSGNTVIISESAKNNANEGRNQAEKAVNKINQIKLASTETSETIKELGTLGSEIEVIVDLIKNIAGQTNLLALNAAIEAARAGEHGKGFAVVADEVKKLATQSAEATDKITEMIKEIQKKTNIAVIAMDESVQEVEEGVVIINDVGQVLDEILEASKKTSLNVQTISDEVNNLARNSDSVVKMMENISAITEEAAAGAEEISSVTQEQTASLEEISASSQALAKIAENLQQLVLTFKV